MTASFKWEVQDVSPLAGTYLEQEDGSRTEPTIRAPTSSYTTGTGLNVQTHELKVEMVFASVADTPVLGLTNEEWNTIGVPEGESYPYTLDEDTSVVFRLRCFDPDEEDVEFKSMSSASDIEGAVYYFTDTSVNVDGVRVPNAGVTALHSGTTGTRSLGGTAGTCIPEDVGDSVIDEVDGAIASSLSAKRAGGNYNRCSVKLVYVPTANYPSISVTGDWYLANQNQTGAITQLNYQAVGKSDLSTVYEIFCFSC